MPSLDRPGLRFAPPRRHFAATRLDTGADSPSVQFHEEEGGISLLVSGQAQPMHRFDGPRPATTAGAVEPLVMQSTVRFTYMHHVSRAGSLTTSSIPTSAPAIRNSSPADRPLASLVLVTIKAGGADAGACVWGSRML